MSEPVQTACSALCVLRQKPGLSRRLPPNEPKGLNELDKRTECHLRPNNQCVPCTHQQRGSQLELINLRGTLHTCCCVPVDGFDARSCGLSQTQLVLLRRSRELGKTKDSDRTNNSRDKASKFTQHRRDVLAQPKDDRPATRVR